MTPRELIDETGRLRWAAEYRAWGEMRRLWVAKAGNDNAPDETPPDIVQANWPGGGATEAGSSRGLSGSARGISRDLPGRVYGNLALKDEPQAIEARPDCPIRFQGQWEDEETGLYYNFYRQYDALAGQFLSSDPLGIGGGLRQHAYVSNPISIADPLGLAAARVLPNGTLCLLIGGILSSG